MLKVALSQLNFCVGNIEGNTEKIISSIQAARKKNIDIVVFPECSITGYPPEDLLHKKYFIKENIKALELIKKASSDIIVIVGFVDTDNSLRIYNSCAVIQDGKILDIYRKVDLPNYGVFDEKRYFTAGRTISQYKYKGYRFTVNICEDLWRRSYVDAVASKNVDFVINISASPFYMGKFVVRKNIISYAAARLRAPVFYCNMVGGQDDLVFDGTSMVVNKHGDVVNVGKRFQEDFIVEKFPLSKKKKTIISKDSVATVFNALILGIKDYVYKNNFEKVVIGVSGGIDSAVVLALAVHALGRSKVTGVLMPSRYSSKETVRDAKKLCENFGVNYHVFEIDDLFQSYLDNLKPFFKNKPVDVTEENIQARIRGNILMAFSNKFGYLVFTTGNKSELSCGYCTLYGDMVGGFAVISDIPKTLVYQLSKYNNQITKTNNKKIPVSIINRAPTAELRENQKDSDSLPEYEILDKILKMYIEDDFSLEDIVSTGVDVKLVKKVVSLVDRNEYKRRQAPVGIKITPRSFGRDRRMPITNKFSQ